MQAHIRALRAIGTEYLNRKLRTLGVVSLIVLLVLCIAGFALLRVSVWWLLVVIPLLAVTVLSLLLEGVVWFLLTNLKPDMSADQKVAVKRFVDKFERLADGVATPRFIILFRVVRDVVRPHGDGFIKSMTTDGSTLHKDYLEFQKRF